VPDNRRVFADLSVDENLEIAERRAEERDMWDKESVYDLFPALRHLRTRKAGVLSGGEQQMLTIGRALVTNPVLILLDEPTEGLAPMIVTQIEEQVEKLRSTGISMLLAEQNVASALKLCDFGYIIDNGRIQYEGTAEDLKSNKDMQRKHLLL
jgi:branched-chain amino acid transport system ATP-binding protein